MTFRPRVGVMERWVGMDSHLQLVGMIILGKDIILRIERIKEENLEWALLLRLCKEIGESLGLRSL